jgi:hypothetical protein
MMRALLVFRTTLRFHRGAMMRLSLSEATDGHRLRFHCGKSREIADIYPKVMCDG